MQPRLAEQSASLIASKRINLSVVAHIAVGLRSVPGGKVFVENLEWTMAR